MYLIVPKILSCERARVVLAVRDALSKGEVVSGPTTRDNDGMANRGVSRTRAAPLKRPEVMRERMNREENSLGVYGLNLELRVQIYFELHPTIHIYQVTSDLDCIYS
jgi:hypothetical protein